MKNSLHSRICKISFLLELTTDSKMFDSIIADSKFDEKDKRLLLIIGDLKRKNLEVNATNVFMHCKDKQILLHYMEIVNAIDQDKYAT